MIENLDQIVINNLNANAGHKKTGINLPVFQVVVMFYWSACGRTRAQQARTSSIPWVPAHQASSEGKWAAAMHWFRLSFAQFRQLVVRCAGGARSEA